jgi:crotonobetainyl-CoA:carnitine CoA-transferase CaiB-like acyl-CoA transferase
MTESIAMTACRRLLAQIGLDETAAGGAVSITGEDPVVASPHRVGAASAAALAAQGAAVAAIWRLRSGRGQDVSVDLRRAAVPGLRTVYAIEQNGKLMRARARGDGVPFFRTADHRQIYLLRAPDYFKMLMGLLDLLQCPNDAPALAKAVAGWRAIELEDALAERRLVGVVARSREEWLTHPQGRWLAARPAIIVEKIGESPPEPFAPAPRPLAGIRVLDVTHVLAGPAAGRTLAEQGAEVLHIASHRNPDTLDKMMDTSFGKRSAFLDLDNEAERAQLATLARDCDIFLDSWRQGVLAKRGFSAPDLAKLRPGAIHVSVSAYGSGGPWGARGGYDPVGQVASGLAIEEGSEDSPLLAPTGTLNDYITAYLATAGALGALIRRAREGGSYKVEVSLTASSMFVMELGMLPRRPKADEVFGLDPLPSDLRTMATPFGVVTHPAPIVEYSETKSYWDRPCVYYGADQPVWLPR